MRTIALHVSSTLCAGATRSNGELLTSAVPVQGSEHLAAAIREALAVIAPAGRLRLVVLVDRPLAQFKRLPTVPASASVEQVAMAVGLIPDRFFIGGGTTFAVGGLGKLDGEWWGTAFDRVLVDAALGASSAGTRLEVEFVATAALRAMRDGAHGENPDESPCIAALDAARRLRFSYEPLAAARRQRLTGLRRRLLIGLVPVLAVFALAAPGIAASVALRHEHRVTRALDAATLERGLDRFGRIRTERMAILDARGPGFPASRTLSDVAALVPLGSAIVTLRADARALDLVILGPEGAAIAERFAGLPGFAEPRVIGAVTRETVEGRVVQRVALHLRRAPAERGTP